TRDRLPVIQDASHVRRPAQTSGCRQRHACPQFSNREPSAALESATFQDASTAGRTHARTKSVNAMTAATSRLIRAFHLTHSLFGCQHVPVGLRTANASKLYWSALRNVKEAPAALPISSESSSFPGSRRPRSMTYFALLGRKPVCYHRCTSQAETRANYAQSVDNACE